MAYKGELVVMNYCTIYLLNVKGIAISCVHEWNNDLVEISKWHID